MVRVEVHAVRPAALRCAYCHDDLHPAAADRCARCGVVLHPECGRALGSCPVLGCRGALPTPRPRVAAWFWFPLLGLVWGAILGIPVLAVAYLFLLLVGLQDGGILGSIVLFFCGPLLAGLAALAVPRLRLACEWLAPLLGFAAGGCASVLAWVAFFALR